MLDLTVLNIHLTSPVVPVAVKHPGTRSLAGQGGLQGKEVCSKLTSQMLQREHQGKAASAGLEPDMWGLSEVPEKAGGEMAKCL